MKKRVFESSNTHARSLDEIVPFRKIIKSKGEEINPLIRSQLKYPQENKHPQDLDDLFETAKNEYGRDWRKQESEIPENLNQSPSNINNRGSLLQDSIIDGSALDSEPRTEEFRKYKRMSRRTLSIRDLQMLEFQSSAKQKVSRMERIRKKQDKVPYTKLDYIIDEDMSIRFPQDNFLKTKHDQNVKFVEKKKRRELRKQQRIQNSKSFEGESKASQKRARQAAIMNKNIGKMAYKFSKFMKQKRSKVSNTEGTVRNLDNFSMDPRRDASKNLDKYVHRSMEPLSRPTNNSSISNSREPNLKKKINLAYSKIAWKIQ